ncbi:MAG: diadenylate cyclase [Candidatus Riflebacteria bacterium]|nr:diadenylate cyclase [Candidatus Riflebacteria bacterium]
MNTLFPPNVAKIFKNDLFENKIFSKKEIEAFPESFLNEFSLLATSPRHEGRVAPYGIHLARKPYDLTNFDVFSSLNIHPKSLRKLVDGRNAFLSFSPDGSQSLVIAKNGGMSDSKCFQIAKNGPYVYRDSFNVIHLFTKDFFFHLDGRQWSQTANVSKFFKEIIKQIPSINQIVLKSILNLTCYRLSKQRVGATLIYCLSENANYSFADEMNFSSAEISIVGNKWKSCLTSFLSQTDGATVISKDGFVIGAGFQLQPSQKAVETIPQAEGTRHTSARRYSFDHPNILAFTISADGPITVFSDGVNLVDNTPVIGKNLQISYAKLAPAKRRDISSQDYEVNCPKCGKKIYVAILTIIGWKEKETGDCPVCGHELVSKMCFSIDTHVLKSMS